MLKDDLLRRLVDCVSDSHCGLLLLPVDVINKHRLAIGRFVGIQEQNSVANYLFPLDLAFFVSEDVFVLDGPRVVKPLQLVLIKKNTDLPNGPHAIVSAHGDGIESLPAAERRHRPD